VNFPVLINLNPGRVNYGNIQDLGQDIRFVDSDDATALNYEIEKYDETDTSTIWVKVPQVASTTTDFIYMYYNSSTAADAQATTSVWDSNFAGVWHLKETATSTAKYIKDSTLNANNGSSTGVSYPAPTSTGQIDGAQSFDGGNDYVDTGKAISALFYPSVVTISAWIRPIGNVASLGFVYAGEGVAGDSGGYIGIYRTNIIGFGDKIWMYNYDSTEDRFGIPYTVDEWTHIVLVHTGGNLYGYKNGSLIGSVFSGDTQAMVGSFGIGLAYLYSAANSYFTGLIDEVRISSSTRSAAWVWNEYKAGTDTLNTYAAAESNLPSAGGGSYTPSPSPIVSLSLNPSLIPYGSSSTLFWSYANVSSCLTPSGWSGPLSLPGSASLIVIPTKTTNYSISCTGRGGYASQSVTLSVSDSSSHNTASFQGNTVSASTSSLPATMLEMEDLLRKLLRELRSLRIKLWRMENPQPFVRNLSFGSEGNDVLSLQLFLITYDSGPYAQRLSSLGANGHFGPNTQRALMEFQESAGIEPHAGYFGQKTRGYVGGL